MKQRLNVKSQDVYHTHMHVQCVACLNDGIPAGFLCHWVPDVLKNAINYILIGLDSMSVVMLPCLAVGILHHLHVLLYEKCPCIAVFTCEKVLLFLADVSHTDTNVSKTCYIY